MEISDKLLCLLSADVRTEDDHYVVGILRRETETGTVEPGGTYRVALISRESNEPVESEPNVGPTPTNGPQSPIETGELRYAEIEDIGKQGDGTARVEHGYIIIAPGVEVSRRMKVEITEVKPNFAVDEVVGDDLWRRSFYGSMPSVILAVFTPPTDHSYK